MTRQQTKDASETAHITEFFIAEPAAGSGYETGALHIIYSEGTEIVQTLPPLKPSTDEVGDYQLYDVKTGKLMSEVWGDADTQSLKTDAPDWAKQLQNRLRNKPNDSLLAADAALKRPSYPAWEPAAWSVVARILPAASTTSPIYRYRE